MRRIYHVGSTVGLAVLLLTAGFVLLAGPQAVFGAALLQTEEDLPPGGFVAVGPPVNSPDQSGHSPALAVQMETGEPWVAFVQSNRLLVSKLVSGTDEWAQQDGALNRSLANIARSPSLDFAGSNRDVAWAAWVEGEVPLVNAAWYNGSNWVLTPILNRDPNRQAIQPVLAAGTTISGTEPLPWVAWVEAVQSDFPQIAVSRAVADAGAQGGYRWEPVGGVQSFDALRNAAMPDLTFAGEGDTTPWLVWREEGGDKPTRVFASRLVANSWQIVGRQENCGTNEVACTLNLDPQRDAHPPRIAAGRLVNETTATPWVVFTEATASGVHVIRVMRLDTGAGDDPSDDRFVPVGGGVNSQCLGNAGLAVQGGAQPDIYFVGNAPHVAWVEGQSRLFVCHLADVRPGQERWDLVSHTPINALPVAPDSPVQLGADGMTPYVAWQEGDEESSVFVARRSPAGPAWAVNRPSAIWAIAGTQASVHSANLSDEIKAAYAELAAPDEMAVRSAPITVTTTANHVHGWEQIEEVEFRLSDANQTIFFARYVVSEDLVYVQVPDDPEVFFPGVKPGPGSPPIPTQYVSMLTRAMRVVNRGAGSPALDLQWVLVFEDAAFYRDYAQAVNLVYDGGQETGFFQVGEVFVGPQVQLPLVANQ
jgi:hypothetical protein